MLAQVAEHGGDDTIGHEVRAVVIELVERDELRVRDLVGRATSLAHEVDVTRAQIDEARDLPRGQVL